jgi:predicted ATP-grasp superfamily ATP-dependent carboligase
VVTRPCVLVTDGEHREALAACRGLADAGYRVATVSDERFPLARWSRFSEERVTLAGPRNDPGGYVDRLVDLLRSGHYDMVLPGTEPALITISEGRERIEPHARLGLPPHETLLESLDKPLLHRRADRAGLSPPHSVVCSSPAEMEVAVRELGFPLVVKPTVSLTRTSGYPRHQTARVVEDAASLEAAATEWPLTIQRYVPGATIVSCAGVRAGGELLGFTVARYERTYPSPVGSAAFAVTIAPPSMLRERVEVLLAEIGWSGIFELELLELEGGFGAIDFNPRPFGWISLAIGAGANLPAIWCDHVLGRTGAPTGDARLGIHYRREDADLRGFAAHLRNGRVRDAAALLRPRRHVVHALFRRDDPGPLVARLFSAVYYEYRLRRYGDRRRRPR